MTYVQPIVVLLLVCFVAARIRLAKSRGVAWLTAAITALFLLSWPPVDWLLSRPLEASCPRGPFPNGAADAIVVLSGGILAKPYDRPYWLPDLDTFRRSEHAAWLFHSWRSVPLLASGGPDTPGRIAASAVMRDLLMRAGVPDGMIWTEERSHSTYENAVFSAQILRNHGISRIALVVDARSMLRAAACFRKQGIAVVPAPCKFRDLAGGWEAWLPNWRSIAENEITLHESAGLAWYWLRGRIRFTPG